jgi:selenide,water dikinase
VGAKAEAMTVAARVLLVGGGHAHLEVLRRQILARRPDCVLTLVSTERQQHYSGMVPGYLRGTYREEEIAFDLAALAARGGGSFVTGSATAIDPRARRVRLADGRALPYDLVSFGVGSLTADGDRPDVRRHALALKPIGRARELRRVVTELAASPPHAATAPLRVVIVGAGAAGVEIACAVAAVLDDAGRARDVTLVDAGAEPLPGYAPRARRRARAILAGKRIGLTLGARVTRVAADAVELEGGAVRPSDATVWLTGAAAEPLFATAGLAVDARGFLLVDASLRSITDPRVFAAGDCATLADRPATPKAGVFAVREGPVLWRSIVAALEHRPPPRYRPQRVFLSILNTADRSALLTWGPLAVQSRAAWRLKDAIDRRFIARYRRV